MTTHAEDRGEFLNVLTHGIGLVGAIAGAVVLIVIASLGGDAWEVVGVSIFGASMITLYAASTAYHAATTPVWKSRLENADLSAIYLLIAGTYTPFMLDELRGGWGWSLFGVIWGLAVFGVVLRLWTTERLRLLSTGIYLVMGWLVVIAAGPLVTDLSRPVLIWLVAGGVAYSAGVPFFLRDRGHAHAIWHLFVIGGTVCHAIAIGLMI